MKKYKRKCIWIWYTYVMMIAMINASSYLWILRQIQPDITADTDHFIEYTRLYTNYQLINKLHGF